MKQILLTKFGSHVYGTNTPSSDTDYKAIFLPEPKDILLQRAPRNINLSTKEDKNARNTCEDIDTEMFALHEYLKLLMQGQTVALDMLFTPEKFYVEQPGYVWNVIKRNKDHFLHKGTTAFVGYARQQAAKYGIKGSRVSAIREAIDFLETSEYSKLFEHEKRINQWIAEVNSEYIRTVEIKGPGGKLELHLEVCNRKLPFNSTFKYARSILQKIFDQYGERALQAEKNEGVDWKALMHAVRVANQAKELLTTANIIFPRPEAEILLQIRKGELPYAQVAEMIEQGLADLEVAKLASELNEVPNEAKAEEIIVDAYAEVIEQAYYERPWW